MKTYGKWTTVLGLVATSVCVSNGATKNSGAEADPAVVVQDNRDTEPEKYKQKQDRLESAQKEYHELLRMFPAVKQLENSYNQANEAYSKTIARETGAIKDEMSRLLAMILEESSRHWAGYRKRSVEIQLAMSKSFYDIDSLKQQITKLAVATNDLANANSNRTALEAEIAKERQKFEALKKKMSELGQQSALESVPEKSPNQKALEQKYALLQRQLWEMTSTNTVIRNATAELNRWRSQLELAISTNAPLKEAKQKLKSAHEESEGMSNRR